MNTVSKVAEIILKKYKERAYEACCDDAIIAGAIVEAANTPVNYSTAMITNFSSVDDSQINLTDVESLKSAIKETLLRAMYHANYITEEKYKELCQTLK
ncbi:MAG: hypothetical protein PUB08_08005 [Firmicutes bacterium]|nr:hypothetical protein [Bacillota bacterium]